jgi:hypothetical protein
LDDDKASNGWCRAERGCNIPQDILSGDNVNRLIRVFMESIRQPGATCAMPLARAPNFRALAANESRLRSRR